MRTATLLLTLDLVCSCFASGFSVSPTSKSLRLLPSSSSSSSSASASSLHLAPTSSFSYRDDCNNSMEKRRSAPKEQRSASALAVSAAPRGGDGSGVEMTAGRLSASFWGTGGFVYILLRSIRKIVPIALEPFGAGEGIVPLTKVQLAAYILTCLWFAYVEGYKGFQRKFSPLVVSRSLTLHPRSPPHHLLLAPLYSMGMFHATKKRVIVSWSVTLGVAALVAGVKRMPYPWRNVVDAGVVVGLSWGMLSILVCYVMACIKGESPTDPSLPDNNNNKQD